MLGKLLVEKDERPGKRRLRHRTSNVQVSSVRHRINN